MIDHGGAAENPRRRGVGRGQIGARHLERREVVLDPEIGTLERQLQRALFEDVIGRRTVAERLQNLRGELEGRVRPGRLVEGPRQVLMQSEPAHGERVVAAVIEHRARQKTEPRRADRILPVVRRESGHQRKRARAEIGIDRRHQGVAPVVHDVARARGRTVADGRGHVDGPRHGVDRLEQEVLSESFARHQRPAGKHVVGRARRRHPAGCEIRALRRLRSRSHELLVRARGIRVDPQAELLGRLGRRNGTRRGGGGRTGRALRVGGTAQSRDCNQNRRRNEKRHGMLTHATDFSRGRRSPTST